jgi:hypothetical protein
MSSFRTDLCHCQDAVISRGVPDLSIWMILASVRFLAFKEGSFSITFFRRY